QVRLKIHDVKCLICRDRLLKALQQGLRGGGFPLTKLVKLAACAAGEDKEAESDRPDHPKRVEEAAAGVAAPASEDGDGRAPVVLSNGRVGGGGGDSQKRPEAAAAAGGGRSGGGASGGRPSDRLRIRAPVTPDLLRQIIGVVQQAAAAVPCEATPAKAAAGAGGSKKGNATAATAGGSAAAGCAAAPNTGTGLADLSAEKWLSTYPPPNPALLEAGEAKANGGGGNGGGGGLRGTGTGSLSFSRGSFGGSSGGSGRADSGERNPWALVERVDRAKDNAFRCCGVIESSAGGSSGSSGDLLESSGGMNGGSSASASSSSSSAMAANMEWNPQFAPRLQEAEGALLEWLTELTMALHGLTFQFTLAFIGGGGGGGGGGDNNDLAASTALAEDLWTAYEESVKRQLELTLEARREQLREQAQPMGIALCFASQNRVLASELLERKRAEMTSLHEATMGVISAAESRPLLQRAEKARQKWSGLLLPEDIYALDDLVERVLRARLQV
ncbi:unnamed protein product, partial [Hapterophycus canaliculatus]